MKWLFYLLALANAGVLVFQYWYMAPPEPPAHPATAQSQPEGPRLVLVSELDRPPQARAQPRPSESRSQVRAQNQPPESRPAVPEKQVAPQRPSPPVCYRISGLPDERQADALAARLRRQNAEIRGRHLQQEMETRYWVSLPPFRSREAAGPTMRRLKRGGISDYYFVTAEPNRNAISLGVFSNPEGAERRRAQVARLGLKPRVEPVEAPKKVYALTLALPAGDSLDRLDFGVWEVQAEETACP